MRQSKLLILVLLVISCNVDQENIRRVVELDVNGDTISVVSIRGNIKQGPLTRFGPNNKKSLIELYENDKIVKKIYYYENGNIGSMGPVVDGQPNGLWIHYYENGNLRSEINMKNGEAVGSFIQYYSNGNIELIGEDMTGFGIFEKYDSLGSPIWKLRFENGEIIDTLRVY